MKRPESHYGPPVGISVRVVEVLVYFFISMASPPSIILPSIIII